MFVSSQELFHFWKCVKQYRDMQLIPLEKIHSSRDLVRKARESHLIDKTRQDKTRAVVCKYGEPGATSKKANFFFISPKRNPFGKLFQKQHSKIPAKLRFCET